MLELHVFGPAFGQPDPSPFCMKGIILMEMSGLPYTRVRGNLQKAPKGKFPVLVDEGEVIPDTSFIRLHLERKHGIDFDHGLSAEQRGLAWAVEKMLEDHLYWHIVQERWADAANFDRGPRHFFSAVPTPLLRSEKSSTQMLLSRKRLFQPSIEPSTYPISFSPSNAPKAIGSSSHSPKNTSSNDLSVGSAKGT